MIERRHVAGAVESLALYSPDGRHRFRLSRRWSAGPEALFIMLNPSTATEMANDPTIERCERRARRWGFGGFSVANLFAFRATRPARLKVAADPVGAGNDAVLLSLARRAELRVCAWGTHGAHLGRGPQVAALLRDEGFPLHHLGLTQGGAPRHPLYLSYDVVPAPWD